MDKLYNLIMNRLLRLIRHPISDRIQARVPFLVFIGISIYLVEILFVSGWLIGSALATPAGEEAAFSPAVAGASVVASGVALGLLITVAAVLGWVSGYRPFLVTWHHVASEVEEALYAELLTAAEDAGFKVVWQDSKKGFIGVLIMENEEEKGYPPALYSPEDAPLRISLLLSRVKEEECTARLKLGVRTAVLWDTGETVRLREIGDSILAKAHIERPCVTSHRN